MASYVDFINSMLNLRSQKLEEEKLKAQQEQENLSAITSAISSLGSSVGSAVSSYNKGTAANKLMNTATPPRAEAVMPGTTDPNVALNKSAAASVLPGQIPYSEVPVTATPATGGEAELKMRMAMDAESRKRMDATIDANQKERTMGISQGHLDLAQQRAAGTTPDQIAADQQRAAAAADAQKRADEERRVKDAEASYKASGEKYQGYEKAADAYNKNTKVVLDALGNATTQEQYLDALGKMESHHQAATAMGLKVEKPPTASWEEHQAMKAKEEQIKAANAGYWWSSKATEQADAEKFTKELQGMPGYGEIRPENTGVVPQVEGNLLATPTMPQPTPLDYQAIRAGATGQVAAPVAGATAATPSQSMSAAEYKAKTGEDVAPGTVKIDAKGRRLLITP